MQVDSIKQNIESFKRKFYLNKLVRGSLISLILFITIFLIFSSLENYFWLGKGVRMAFLIVLLGAFGFILTYGVAIPLSGLLKLRKGISDEDAAKEVGKYFTDVNDKLLNYLQLQKLNISEISLVNAALLQKTESLKIVPFRNAINLRPNLRFVFIVIGLVGLLGLVSFVNPGFISNSSSRIIQFNKEFAKPAPFKFVVSDNLLAYKNESYQLNVRLEGEYIPDNVFLLDNDRKIRLNKSSGNTYSFKYPSISASKEIQFEASGFMSNTHTIEVYDRPEIREFQIDIDYPKYTGLKDKVVENTGSLIVPEGTILTWVLNTTHSNKVIFRSNNESKDFQKYEDQLFTYTSIITSPIKYEIQLNNEFASNKSKIQYELSIINDQNASIDVEYLPDTITYKSILLSGNISDDYGFRSLRLYYKQNNDQTYNSKNIPIDKNQNNQQFFYQWDLDSSLLSGNVGIELFIRVQDNDIVNGFKSTDSRKFYFKVPNEEELKKLVDEASGEAESQINKSEKTSEELNLKLRKLEERLKNNKEVGWQEEKLMEDILKEKEKLEEELNDMKKRHEELMRSQKEFGKQSEKMQEKSQKLQELINETLNEETRKLFEELQKLMKEKAGSEKLLEKLSDVQNKERNIERELERMKELFKRLKFEAKVEEVAQKMKELAEKQNNLAEQTKDLDQKTNSSEETSSNEDPKTEDSSKNSPEKNSDTSSEDEKSKETEELINEQEQIKESFEDLKEQIEEAEELNQDLKKPEPLEDFNQDNKDLDEKLKEIPENIKQKNFKKAQQQQQNSSQKMQEMSSKLNKMQMSMEMGVMQENIDHLRDILDNLIKLSFEQESLIESFQGVQQVDPRFIDLSQEQLKLIDNSEVIEDSLISLASRVVQISNFVTREIDQINKNLDKAMNELRERNKGKATSHQQFAMTSMNNLALLLDDVLSQMQMAMSEAMGGKPQQKGENQNSRPSMSEMQQELSKQIQQLKKSGKSGRELSEELAKLAAEQAEIRRMLEEAQEGQNGKPTIGEDGEKDGGSKNGSSLKDAIEKMEENEVDLVNKRITQELIDRQQNILTRLLEAEESMREQKESPEREGETASDNIRRIPPEFEEYLKAKRSEIELLKTIPIDLNPFYKKEVNDYFRRLSGQEK